MVCRSLIRLIDSVKNHRSNIVDTSLMIVFLSHCAQRIDRPFYHCIKHSSLPHSLIFDYLVGDAPVATARYRVFTAPDNVSYTEIDRLGILPHYRGRKLSRKVMLGILSDSQEVSRSPISVVLLSIPAESWIQSKLESMGWSVNLMSSMEQRGPRMFFQMIFHATPS
jgi:hypothetical protein